MAGMVRSQYTYDRSVQRDVARVLRDMRGHVGGSPLEVLDQVARAIADEFGEYDRHFDADDFLTRCQHMHGRDDPAGREMTGETDG